jgi:PadR family transcriptional regulator AphA
VTFKPTTSSYVVLTLVERLAPVTAYDLKRVASSSVLNFWALPHTVLYTETRRLAEAALLAAEQEPGGRRRRAFSLTPAGLEALDAWRSEPAEDFFELRDPGLLRLFAGGDPLKVGAAQRERHRRQLTEYEKMARALDDGPGTTAVRSTLAAGLALERAYLEFWSTIAEQGSVVPDTRAQNDGELT